MLLVFISIANLKLYIPWFAVGWKLGEVDWSSVRADDGHSSARNMLRI